MTKPKYTDEELRAMYDKELEARAAFEAAPTPEEVQKENEAATTLTEDIQDGVVGAGQGFTMNSLDEIAGVGNMVLQTGGGRKDMSPEDLIQQGAAPIRQAYKTAKERNPVITTVSEVGGAILSPTSKIPYFGQMNPIAREGIEGLVSGAMSKDKKITEFDTQDVQDTGMSGVLSAGMSGAVQGGKKILSEGSDVIRARALGAGTKEFGEIGVKSRKQIADKLAKDGLFSGTNVEFNPRTMKFEKTKQTIASASDLNLPTPQRLQKRVTEAVDKIQQAKEYQFGNHMATMDVDPKSIRVSMMSAVDDYASENPHLTQARLQGLKKVDEFMEKLIVEAGPGKKPTVADMDNLKSQLYDYTRYGKSEGDLSDAQILYQKVARNLKEMVNKEMATIPNGSKFKEMNEAQSNYLTAKFDIDSRVDSLSAAGSKPDFNPLRMAAKAVQGEDQLRQAGARDILDKIALPIRQGMGEAIQDTPGVMTRQHLNQDQQIPYAPTQPQVNVPARFRNLPEALMETPLKRDSQWLWQNKDLVFAKMFQFAPDLAGSVVESAKKGPEKFKQNISFLLNSPDPMIKDNLRSMFEDNKYNMMDGEILDPQMKMLAMDDVRWNNKIGSVQKAKLLNKIQRGEKLV